MKPIINIPDIKLKKTSSAGYFAVRYKKKKIGNLLKTNPGWFSNVEADDGTPGSGRGNTAHDAVFNAMNHATECCLKEQGHQIVRSQSA